jgi:hypothetical protein
VGATAVGLIALFVAFMFLAKKLGWIVSASDCRALISEQASQWQANAKAGSAWDYQQVSQVGGGEIHQLAA